MISINTRQFGKWIIAVCAVLLAVPALASNPYAEWADEFGIDLNASYDGTRVMEMKDGSFEFVEHKAPGKMYTQVNMGGMSSGIILREDLGKGYMMMPSMGMYREISLDEGVMQNSNGMEFQSIEEVGRDEILGFPSTKFQTRFEDNDGKGAGHVWVTDDGVPIKMDMIYTSRDIKGMRLNMEFVELNMREQDPAIFELPADLKPMGISGMLSGAGLGDMIPGMSRQPQAEPAGSKAGAASPSSSMSRQLTTDDLTQSVQLHLQHIGIDPGNTSGEVSLETQIAISQFQASRGLAVTGEVSPQLLGILAAEVDSGQ